ncbi:MAG TPA: hypothetical protein VN366_05930 [Feifaniaceae bacterium]|nr:hypothetical protein [Feifaniaceae bacterium]
MKRVITNETCGLYHTPQCDLLNMPSCEVCVMNGKEEESGQVISDLEVLSSLLPESGIHPLFDTDECRLCKKPHPNKRAYYGLMDLGHPEPKRSKRSVIGLKVKSAVGSLVPVQISVCNACRKRILMLEYLPILLPLVVGILTLVVLMLPGVSDALERIAMLLPFALFLVLVVAAAVAGRVLANTLEKRYAEQTELDPFNLPILKEMKENGWFPINVNGKRLRLVFVKKRMHMGVGTGTPEDAICPAEQ